MEYRPGKFLAAMRERASMENEQNVFTLRTESGEMVFKQIAGLIARRVVSWKKQGEQVVCGERIGLVRFGTRVDVWLRSEEHTSELQSQSNLVCRLLLEKKKTT